VNHYNLLASKKNTFAQIIYTRQNIQFLRKLNAMGVINNFIIHKSKKIKNTRLITFSVSMYKNEPFYSKIRLVSKPSKSYNLTLKHLSVLKTKLHKTELLLSTNVGFLTLHEALLKNVSGKLFCILS